MKKTALWLVFLLLPTLASAQTVTVPIGRSYQVAFDHDGQNVTEFRVTLDGTRIQTLPASALVNGTVTSAPQTMAAGSHALVVSAFNANAPAGQQEAAAPALTLVGCANCSTPNAPKNLTIKIVGTVALNDKGEVTGIAITSATVDPPVTITPTKRR